MSPFVFFTMSKFQTFAWALICLGLGILLFFVHLGICSTIFIIYASLLGSIAAYKFIRDRGIISQAKQANAQPPRIAAPAMTGKSTSRLFVPEPLHQ